MDPLIRLRSKKEIEKLREDPEKFGKEKAEEVLKELEEDEN